MVLLPTYEGRLPWLKAFMSFSLFQIIGRLTYTSYLIHQSLIFLYLAAGENTLVTTADSVIYKYFGIYAIAYLAAFILTLLSESPTLNLEKTLLFPPRKRLNHEAKGGAAEWRGSSGAAYTVDSKPEREDGEIRSQNGRSTGFTFGKAHRKDSRFPSFE